MLILGIVCVSGVSSGIEGRWKGYEPFNLLLCNAASSCQGVELVHQLGAVAVVARLRHLYGVSGDGRASNCSGSGRVEKGVQTTMTVQEMKTYLEDMRVMRRSMGNALPGYTGAEDFVLQHGREQVPVNLPKGVRRGTPKACYNNAFDLVMRHPKKYVYCEGFAYVCVLPVHHAWVAPVGDLTKAIDVTWGKELQGVYIGVPFKTDFVRRVAQKSRHGFCMLDRWEDGWPLLTGKESVAEALL
jgi:hypothetical protein